MLHAKFRDHRDSDYDKDVLKLFTIYGCGVHLVMRPWAFIQTFVPNSREDA